MNIIVLIKQVPARLQAELNEDFTIKREWTDSMMNPADMSALALAAGLRLSKTKNVETVSMASSEAGRIRSGVFVDAGSPASKPSPISVCAMSMGPMRAANCLREAAVGGADRLVLVSDGRFAGADSLLTARILARAVQKIGGADLVLCGYRTVDGETGQVGPELSRFLGYHCVTAVTQLQSISETELLCRRLTAEGESSVCVTLPAVVTVRSFPVPVRLPDIRSLRRARRMTVESLDAAALGFAADFSAFSASPTRVLGTDSRGSRRRSCRYFRSEQAAGEILNILGEHTTDG